MTLLPLRLRSWYSLLQGIHSPAELCRLAKGFGYGGLAITDRDNLCGLWPFLQGCREEGLRPVVGAEVSEPGSARSVTCLVKNDTGYANLCTLLTRRHLATAGFTLARELPDLAEGLFTLCTDLPLLTALHRRGITVVADLGPRPTAAGRQLREWCCHRGVAAVTTADCTLGCAADQPLAGLVEAIRTGGTIGRGREQAGAAEAGLLVSGQEYAARFAIWPEVMPATVSLAEACSFTGPQFGVVMPPWREAGGRPAGVVLREKAYRGARRRYGDDLGEPVIERLEEELKTIEKMGFSSYFLVVRDIVLRRGADGHRVRRRICGRGSGAASLVAYSLGITNVCPIKYNLYFARFLNPGRTDPPDIDIDFPWDERDGVLQEVLDDHAGHAALVCNHVCFQPRMAIRETARAFGLPDQEISRITSRLPWLADDREDLQSSLTGLAALRDEDLGPPWPEIVGLAEKLLGMPRYLSVHPGGVVITPEPLCRYVPVQMAVKGVPVIQWEKEGAEAAGLVKIDLLGNRSLAVVRDALAAVRQEGGELEEEGWHPEDDPLTRLLVAEGATMGCFYIESPAMRLLEKKAGSGDFNQLVIQSSIIRPAANEFVREYVRRLHGGVWQPICPELEGVLEETFGLMVYQEDVSRVAVTLAGFSDADADRLRRIMAKKEKTLRLRHYREMFFNGCAGRGLALSVVDQVWRMIESFAGYSFCKPHSASYARVSFQAAYLKRHHPAAFMAAVLSNQGGYYSTFAYVSEAKRLGLKILHPDVQQSAVGWSGQGTELRVGLQAIKGLSGELPARIVAAREGESFSDCEDFYARIEPAADEARALIHAGALDQLAPGGNRAELLWQWAYRWRARQDGLPPTLFAAPAPPPPKLPLPETRNRLRREYQVLGFLCEHHPLELLDRRGRGLLPIARLAERRGQRVTVAAWLLTGKLVATRNGAMMEFLTFEDETGQVETTFFPEVYTAHAHLLCHGRGYILTGLVEEDYGALTLTAERLKPFGPVHF